MAMKRNELCTLKTLIIGGSKRDDRSTSIDRGILGVHVTRNVFTNDSNLPSTVAQESYSCGQTSNTST